jgi:hypothetical protein
MEGGSVRFEVRPFNRIAGLLGRSTGFPMCMPAGASIDDLLRHLNVKRSEVFLVFVNGRDITPDLNAPVRVDYSIQDDDVIALSGPVPYSWGYGSPVV